MVERVGSNELLEFIQSCIREGRIIWTYHANVRLLKRLISRQDIIVAVESYEILEDYPQDKYFPSCLVYLKNEGRVFHFVCALDVIERKVWIVTAYQPDPQEWDTDYRKRRTT
ncbi:MAG: DUF4258 domain-containing protein [Leptospirales bacterium]